MASNAAAFRSIRYQPREVAKGAIDATAHGVALMEQEKKRKADTAEAERQRLAKQQATNIKDLSAFSKRADELAIKGESVFLRKINSIKDETLKNAIAAENDPLEMQLLLSRANTEINNVSAKASQYKESIAKVGDPDYFGKQNAERTANVNFVNQGILDGRDYDSIFGMAEEFSPFEKNYDISAALSEGFNDWKQNSFPKRESTTRDVVDGEQKFTTRNIVTQSDIEEAYSGLKGRIESKMDQDPNFARTVGYKGGVDAVAQADWEANYEPFIQAQMASRKVEERGMSSSDGTSVGERDKQAQLDRYVDFTVDAATNSPNNLVGRTISTKDDKYAKIADASHDVYDGRVQLIVRGSDTRNGDPLVEAFDIFNPDKKTAAGEYQRLNSAYIGDIDAGFGKVGTADISNELINDVVNRTQGFSPSSKGVPEDLYVTLSRDKASSGVMPNTHKDVAKKVAERFGNRVQLMEDDKTFERGVGYKVEYTDSKGKKHSDRVVIKKNSGNPELKAILEEVETSILGSPKVDKKEEKNVKAVTSSEFEARVKKVMAELGLSEDIVRERLSGSYEIIE